MRARQDVLVVNSPSSRFRIRRGGVVGAFDAAVAIRFTLRALSGSLMTHPGIYCLRSNETGWDEATLWRTCFLLTDVEAGFRSLKSELGLQPICPHQPFCTEGDLFISVLAYQLVQVIRMRLRQAGEHASWTTLRGILEGQQRITGTFRRADDRTLHVRTLLGSETPGWPGHDHHQHRTTKGDRQPLPDTAGSTRY